VIVLFPLMPHGEDDDLGGADDLVQRHTAGVAERNDQLALRRVRGGLWKTERRDREPMHGRRTDGLQGFLGTVQVLVGLGAVSSGSTRICGMTAVFMREGCIALALRHLLTWTTGGMCSSVTSRGHHYI
jgi:hypothetical protein